MNANSRRGEAGSPLFWHGDVVATHSALILLKGMRLSPLTFLQRHIHGDWGEVGEADRQCNNEAVTLGHRILSSYKLGKPSVNGSGRPVSLWVITEADRSYTTILLPEDY